MQAITLEEWVHDNMAQMTDVEKTAFDAMLQNLEKTKNLERISLDHEKRIRFLERVINYGIGAFALFKLIMDSVEKTF